MEVLKIILIAVLAMVGVFFVVAVISASILSSRISRKEEQQELASKIKNDT